MGTTVLMRQRGTITIPAKIREKYDFEDGMPFTVVDLGEGVLVLAPKTSRFPELSAEFTRQIEEAGVSLEDLLEGLQEEVALQNSVVAGFG